MTTRPLDRFAAALTLVLCIVWGFNQVVACVVLYAALTKRRIFRVDGVGGGGPARWAPVHRRIHRALRIAPLDDGVAGDRLHLRGAVLCGPRRAPRP